MRPDAFVCVTCGTEYAPALTPPDRCPICLDERQYVGHDGQRWTTLAEVATSHQARIEELEPGLVAIGTEPGFAIGQRALVSRGLLWDCITLLDDRAAAAVEAAGGIGAIAISHPHYYSSMVEWAERFDVRVLLHQADRQWIMRPSPRVELWAGERLQLSDEHELVRLGGHFDGGTVCVWHAGAGGQGTLLAGDIVQVAADRDWVSFMYSYPNMIPLPTGEIRRMREVIETLRFESLHGAFWGQDIARDGRRKVLASANRYLAALSR
jgi:hypothetical protein